MASNGEIEAEDAEITENNGEKVVTMMDVLQEQEEFEQDANAVLGASDDKNCTYALGYIKRQAIYACMTCCSEAKEDPSKRAGVCLACSLICHENHELIELYTKRNFRCDCGNPKFNSHPCQFTPTKTDLNEENSYNQNFSGVYCTCHRPYPDPEAKEEDEMIQCIICEDWLHASHLDATVPSVPYDEMICKNCMENNEFLHDYSDLIINTDSDYVDIEGLNTSTEVNGDDKTEKQNIEEETTKEANQSTVDVEMSHENNTGSEGNLEITDTKEVDDNKEEKIDDNMVINASASIDTDDQTANNTAMDTSNTELSTSTPQEETKGEEKMDTLCESTNAEAENKITESKGSDEENIDSHINALKEIVESSEEIFNKDINNKETIVDANADAIENNTEVDSLQTDSKVPEPDENISNKVDVSNETHTDTTEETPNITKPETIATEELNSTQNENKNTNDDGRNSETMATHDEESKQKPEELTGTEISNVENDEKTPIIKSAEELEKMEEDKLLEDPDENKPEDTSDNKESQINDGAKEPSELNKSNENVKPNKLVAENIEVVTSTENSINIPNGNDESSSSINTEIKGKNGTAGETNEKPEIKRKLSSEAQNAEAKKRKVDEIECKRNKSIKKHCKGATFWPTNFRQKLCTCNECLSMYKDLSVSFLLDSEDTVGAYESLGKAKTNGKPQSQYEKGLQALSSLDRIQQINVLTEYNKMRDKFLDFLKSFKDAKKIVTEEDVKAFFADMKPTKRPDGVYFCR